METVTEMKLFFDPLRDNPEVEPLNPHVEQDMRLEELLHGFLSSRELERSALRILNEFCSDPEIIRFRQGFIGDLTENDGLYEMFTTLRDNVFEMKILYELKMFKEVPEMGTMKTFLLVERFAETYQTLVAQAKAIQGPVSKATEEILSAILAPEHTGPVDSLISDIKAVRAELETIGEVRFNRYFSRGQNIENSVLAKTETASLTAQITDIVKRLGVDPSEVEKSALLGKKEFTRPVFIAVFELYRDIFRKVDEFHEKYTGFFSVTWFALIEKLNACLAFAIIFRKLKERNFPYAKAEISDVTDIHDFYSFFLVTRDFTPDQVVFNDYKYDQTTSFYFITGPNGGGKTIFLTSVCLNQLFFQATGLVPAREAKIRVMRKVFTHFPVEEYNDKSGRLVEEQGRVEEIFRAITDDDCMALFNETYSSTKADIAYKMSVELCEQVMDRKVKGLFVTHLHSLKDYARESKERRTPNIGILTALNNEETGKRLYKIVPLSDQNSSYARDILRKYDMTVEKMMERIRKKTAAAEEKEGE